MRRLLFSFLLLSLAGVATTRSGAQNYLYGTGNPVWGINIPIENGFINVANGNVHIEIPFVSETQRGSLPFTENFVYDSRIWQIVDFGTAYQFQPAPTSTQTGWEIQGLSYGALQENPVGLTVPCKGSGSQNYAQSTFTWQDSSGTSHLFAPPVYQFSGATCANGNTLNISDTPSGSAYATDGSGYYISVTGYFNAMVFDQNGNSSAQEDRNGNYISTSYDENQNGYHIYDTLGREPVIQSFTNNGGSLGETGWPSGPATFNYDVLTIGGARKRYTVTTEQINVATHFGQSAVLEYQGTQSTASIIVVKSVGLPDGSSYIFHYDVDADQGLGTYGELTQLDLPTGGSAHFTYQNYTDSYNNINRWIASYSGGNGSYTFLPSANIPCLDPTQHQCETVTVTDGNKNQVSYLLTLNNGAWNTTATYSNYNSTTHALSQILSTATNYSFQNSCPAAVCGGGAEWITANCTTTKLIDTGQVTQTGYVYNNPQYGKPDKVQTWDYAPSASGCTSTTPSTPTKETDYTYGYFVNGAPYVTQIQQLDSGGHLAAQASFGYDCNAPNPPQNCTLSPTSGLPNHSLELLYAGSTPVPLGNRGNLTSVTTGVGTTTVTTGSLYDDAGTKLSDIDPNGNQKTYTTMCSDAFVSGVTYPIKVGSTSLAASMVFDCSSGLVTSTKDINSNQTVYSYITSGSNVGRLQAVARPDGGSATYAYPSVTEVDQTVAQTSSISVTRESIFDSYGRKYQSVTLAPEGSISSETTYDLTGRPYAVTTPHLQGTVSSTDGTAYTYYDVLGRVTKVIAPDGSTATSTYVGNTQTVTDALSHSKKYTEDAFGRLTSVLEPNSGGTLANETDYQYNALDKLTQVDQWGGAKNATTPGDRQRVFSYDSLGRMISETTPEAGTTTTEGGTVTYSYLTNSVLCAGDVTLPCSKTDARSVKTQYTYDALSRRLSKSYSSDASGTPISCFQYDTSSVTGAAGNLLGHLTNQWTQSASSGSCNSAVLTNGGYLTLKATLSYDVMGRPLSGQQCTPANCTAAPYALNYGYDLAGNLTSYSSGLASTPGAGSNPLMFYQSFDSANRLQRVASSWSDSLHPATLFSTQTGQTVPAYAPFGAVTNGIYGNGITVNRFFNSRLLPTSESDTTNSVASSGTAGSTAVVVTGAEQSK